MKSRVQHRHMRTRTAYRRFLPDPIRWLLRPDMVPVFHKIELIEEITAVGKYPKAGLLPQSARMPTRHIMQLVKLQMRCDLNDPSVDLAAMVGYIDIEHPQKPELWFWKDQFWVKAIGVDGIEYYKDKCFLLYPITIADEDRLHSSLKI